MKTCSKCKVEKSFDNFYISRHTSPILYQSWCRGCVSVKRKKPEKTKRVCTGCKIEKPLELEYFHRAGVQRLGGERYASRCVACKREEYLRTREQKIAYQRAHHLKPGVFLKSKSTRLKKAYGISIEDFDRMKKEQGSACLICKKVLTGWGRKGLYVDHNHQTGVVRGLLCSPCNVGLGGFKDSLEALKEAVKYLEKDLRRQYVR